MNRVFISHSHKQDAFVKQIANEVGRDNCIIDCFDFEPGSKIESEIRRSIDRASVFCLLITDDSLRSEWVRFEEDYVKERIAQRKIVFRAIIVEESIKGNDERISLWEKNYLLNVLPSSKIIARVLKSQLKSLNQESFPHLKYKESLFIGRGAELNDLENNYILKSSENCKAVIVSGLPHIGRKRFALAFLRKISDDLRKDFCRISLRSEQSIEDFIFFLNDYVEEYQILSLTTFLAEADMNKKKSKAIELLNKLYEYHQYLLIVDDNCIVRKKGDIVSWFKEILTDQRLEKHTGIYIISSLRVNPTLVGKLPLVQQMLNPLKPNDIAVLFQAYSEKRNLHIQKQDIDLFSSEIGGFPPYVFPIVDEWATYGKSGARRKLEELKQSTEDILSHIIDLLNEENDEKKVQLLVLLSKFDIASIQQLEKLLPGTNLDQILDLFQELSILEYFGFAREYVRIHPAVADYINRSKQLSLPQNIVSHLMKSAEALVFTGEAQDSDDDLPTYLFGIKETLRQGASKEKDISRYMIPSLALSVIVEEYEKEMYLSVINLCERMLERKKKYDGHIVRSVHYWQCLAYCRLKDPRLPEAVKYFGESHTMHFLLGFYFRIQGNIPQAESEFEHSIMLAGTSIVPAKAKQELVLIRIMQRDYSGALALAEENYCRQPHNYFFIEAYFRCYVKDVYADSTILLRLIDEMKKSQDNNKMAISQTMSAEFDYYRRGDFWSSTNQLKRIILNNPSLKYPQDSLKEICHDAKNDTYFKSILLELREKGIRF